MKITPEIMGLDNGHVVHWDLVVDDQIPLQEQANSLKEDLVQVEYRDGIVLDIGWYPSFTPDGNFKVTLIKNQNWETPLYQKEARSIESLKNAVKDAISFTK